MESHVIQGKSWEDTAHMGLVHSHGYKNIEWKLICRKRLIGSFTHAIINQVF